MRNARHPNAARLLIDFYLGAEGQLLYASTGLIPVVDGILEKADPAMRDLAGAKLLGATSPEEQQAMLALATEMYK